MVKLNVCGDVKKRPCLLQMGAILPSVVLRYIYIHINMIAHLVSVPLASVSDTLSAQSLITMPQQHSGPWSNALLLCFLATTVLSPLCAGSPTPKGGDAASTADSELRVQSPVANRYILFPSR